MDDPFFSIVVPTYNRAQTIGHAIESVLAQDFMSFEVIIIDDGSTDDTPSVIGSFSDPRLKYFRQPNRERAAARNAGTKEAIGRYVTFLDSDDLFRPYHLSEGFRFITENQPCVFHVGYNVILPDGTVLVQWKPLPSPANLVLLKGNYFSCLGVFIRRDVALSFPFNEDRDLSGSEDYELWLRLAARYELLACPEVTSSLVHHGSRSVISTSPEKLIRRIDLLRKSIFRDDSVRDRFGPKLHLWEAFLDIYIALHLALMKGSIMASLGFLTRSALKAPKVILSHRFWVVPKKLLFR